MTDTSSASTPTAGTTPTAHSAAPPPDVVPQHLVIVLPSTGEFDSRTYRIATACIARGHTVTVVARHLALLATSLGDGGIPIEGFNEVHVLRSQAEIDGASVERLKARRPA